MIKSNLRPPNSQSSFFASRDFSPPSLLSSRLSVCFTFLHNNRKRSSHSTANKLIREYINAKTTTTTTIHPKPHKLFRKIFAIFGWFLRSLLRLLGCHSTVTDYHETLAARYGCRGISVMENVDSWRILKANPQRRSVCSINLLGCDSLGEAKGKPFP